MTSIQKCTNYGTSQPECQAAGLSLNYLVNPCGPSPGSTAHQWSADKDVSISERSQPLVVSGAATCDVTDWFCQMLQGLYHSKCSGKPHLEDIQKRENYHSKCNVPLGKIDVCFKLARYIYEELGDAFIDGECLRIHQKHLKTHNGYTELMVQIDDEHCKPVLAYYKPQRVYLKVFSANEGEEQVQVDMGSEITCEKIKDAVFKQIKHTELYRDKPLDIVLRSSDQVKYHSVSDDNIHDILESSALFYDAISSDEQLVKLDASWRMSDETYDRLKRVINGLKESTSRDETITPVAEANLFTDLAFVYNSDDGEAMQEALGVVIERYDDLTQHEPFILFKRLAAVYERNMYNKFFVPIWAVAMNADKSVGYALYPKLTQLREVLKDLKESYQTSDVYYDKLNQVLRLCFAPVALAIDALHTPIFNQRMMYHHRDICIDNIYMRARKGIDSSGQENVEYDDVRLKLTEITREVLPNDVDISLSSKCLLTEYYHHADVNYSSEPFDRKHDWYSFGVYILEVLHLTLPVTTEMGFHQIQDYTDDSHVVSWIVSSSEVDEIRPFLSQYLDIAVKCLKLKPNEHQPLSYEIPDEMKQRFLDPSQTFQMYFEYSVSTWTAQLLWMYDESRPREMPDDGEDEVCQACLLRPTESISTKQHGRGNQLKCDENCQYHCLLCYTNEERLFCSRQHGTTGTIVDHRYSYALILYGQSFEDVCRKDAESAGINPFKGEADMLARALKSKYICGLCEANIHVRPVYGNGTPEDCLKRHCEEMRELIHGDGNSSCSNDTSYTLFTFYFGHSYHGCDKTVGDWCPSFTHTSDDTFEPLRLKRALVHYHMTSIQKCTNYGTSQPECQAACLSLNYLVNPCRPSPGSTAHQWSADKDVSISERSQPLALTGAASCDITDWLCQMLQGQYHRDCSGKPHLEDIQKRENYHSKCKVPLGKIDVCFKLARYIYEELGNAFIDGECLRIHQKHLKTRNGYTELMVQIDDEFCKPVLAYYKPQGTFQKVFSANEGEEQVQIDMGSEITCEKIKNAAFNQIKDEEQYGNKPLDIVLRSSDQVKYPAVSDDNIHDILEASVLFYHAISLEDQDGAMKTEIVEQKYFQVNLVSLLENYVRHKSQLTAEILQRHLSAIPDIKYRYKVLTRTYEQSQTVCHFAARRGDMDILKCVVNAVEYEQQYNLLMLQDRDGNTVIADAACNGHTEIVQHILNTVDSDMRYEMLKVQNRNAQSTLHRASLNGHTEVLKAIRDSVTAEQLHSLQMLLDANGNPAIALAAYNGHTETVQFILYTVDSDRRYEMLSVQNKGGQSALYSAALYGHTGVLKVMIDLVSTEQLYNLLMLQDSDGDTFISLAAYNGHTETVQYVLNSVDSDMRYKILHVLNKNDQSTLLMSALKGHTEVLNAIRDLMTAEQLFDLLMLRDSDGEVAIALAADNGHTETVQYILNCVDPDKRFEMLQMRNTKGLSTLHLGAKNGHINALKTIKASITEEQRYHLLMLEDSWGNTSIGLAAYNGHTETVQYILNSVDSDMRYEILRVQNEKGRSALKIAVLKGHTSVLKAIVNSVNEEQQYQMLMKQDCNGNTAVTIAAFNGYTEIVQYILTTVDSDKRYEMLELLSESGQTVLHRAAVQGNRDVIVVILDSVTEEQKCNLLMIKSNNGNTPITLAAYRGHTETVQYILDAVNTNIRYDMLKMQSKSGRTVLHSAASRGYIGVLKAILHSVTETQRYELLTLQGNDGNTAISLAAYNGHTETVQGMLNSLSFDMRYEMLTVQNIIGQTTLHCTVLFGHTYLLHVILSWIPEKQRYDLLKMVDRYGDSAIAFAAFNGHAETVKYMLDAIDLDGRCEILKGQNESGQTTLHRAALHGHTHVLKLILDSVTEIVMYSIFMLQDSNGDTPIAIAAKNGHSATVQCMLDTVDYDRRYEMLRLIDNRGLSILHVPVRNRHVNVLKAILSSLTGEQLYKLVMVQSGSKKTAVHVAAKYGYTDILELIHHSVPSTMWHTLLALKDSAGHNALLSTLSNKHVAAALYILKTLPQELMVNMFATQNDKGSMPLNIAAHDGYLDVVQCSLELVSSDQQRDLLTAIDNQGNGILFEAAAQGHTEIVKHVQHISGTELWLSLLAASNVGGKTALHQAAFQGHADTVGTILHSLSTEQVHTLLTLQDNSGDTPVASAMSNGHMELVKQLLGADDPSEIWEISKIQNQLGKTVLHFSASCEQLQQFKDFLENILSSEQLSELCSIKDRSGKTADEVTTKSEEASQLISDEEADVEEQGEGILHPPVQETASNCLASSEEDNSKVTCTDSIGRSLYNITEDLPTNTETVEASLAKSLGLKALKDLKRLPPKESSAVSDVNISTAGPQSLTDILWEKHEPPEAQDPKGLPSKESNAMPDVNISTAEPQPLTEIPPEHTEQPESQGGELGYSTKLLEDKVRELRHRVEVLEKQQLLQQLQELREQKEKQFVVTQDLQERIHQQEMELSEQKKEQFRNRQDLQKGIHQQEKELSEQKEAQLHVRKECAELHARNMQLAKELSEQKEEQLQVRQECAQLQEQNRELEMELSEQKEAQHHVRYECAELQEKNSRLAMDLSEQKERQLRVTQELQEEIEWQKKELCEQKVEQLQVRKECDQLREQNSQLALGMEEIKKHLGLPSIPSKDLATPKSNISSGMLTLTKPLDEEEADG